MMLEPLSCQPISFCFHKESKVWEIKLKFIKGQYIFNPSYSLSTFSTRRKMEMIGELEQIHFIFCSLIRFFFFFLFFLYNTISSYCIDALAYFQQQLYNCHLIGLARACFEREY